MSKSQDPQPAEPRSGLKAESLAKGISLLLVLMVFQRVVGFGRNILFCRWLSPEELGRWNLSFSMLVLAAPLVVIGLPGSFGRYAEHYRAKGQLKSFLRRITSLTLLLAMIGLFIICYARRTSSWLFFGDESQTQLLVITVLCLVSVISFNFLTELFTSLRQLRTVSMMQFSNGLLFAVFGLGLIHFWDSTAYAIVVGYGLACLASCLLAMIPLVKAWRTLDDELEAPAQSQMWAKLLPFAAWIWFSDLLSNLFGAADRYMIVHFSHADPQQATEVVGQYHSSLVVPTLLIAIASMVASVVLPYVASDWEAGDKKRVAYRLNLAIKSYGLLSIAAGIVVLTCSSLIFGWALGGKYQDGLAVLPWTLVFCTWGGMSVIARAYLLCIEKAGVATLGPLLGLVVNVGLNFLLLPRYGLHGAVWATTAGNIVTLAIAVKHCSQHGFKLELGTILVCLLPICLLFGTPGAVGCIIGILFISINREWLINANEKAEVMDRANETINKILNPILRKMGKATV